MARRRALRMGLPEFLHRWRHAEVAPGSHALASEPRRFGQRGVRLRAVRRRDVPMLRPLEGPDVANRGRGSGRRTSCRPGAVAVATRAHEPRIDRHAAAARPPRSLALTVRRNRTSNVTGVAWGPVRAVLDATHHVPYLL